MNSCAGSDDIYDGIDCADFVKVNLADRGVVNLRLCVAEKLEGADRSPLHRLIERGILNEVSDDTQRTTVPMV